MNYKMYLAFFLLGAFLPCNGQANWNGGAVKREGIYENDEIKIIVSDDKYLLKYTALKTNGDTLFVNPDELSTVHKWALHLDKAGNLWVFSSDKGDFCWRITGPGPSYKKIYFVGLLKKDSIPAECIQYIEGILPL